MKVRYQYKNLSAKEQALFEEYLDSKMEQIDPLLSHFAEDAVMLESRADKFEKHDAYEVELVLKLPTKSLKSKETSHAITKAIDLSKDRLVAQLKKMQGLLRKEQLMTRRHSSIRKPEIHEENIVEKLMLRNL
jgi:ribosome-associated translation inhibitor RaiA